MFSGLSPRWRKLLGDVRAERGRMLLMVAAIAVSLTGVGGVLGAYAVLTREIAASYLGTSPADVTLDMPDGVDTALLTATRQMPGVADASAREVVLGRARIGTAGEWRRLLLFVVDDFNDLRLNTFRSESGAWPPPTGTMLVERSALGMLETATGQSVQVRTPGGAEHTVPVTGVVHDPGLAPAWQERSGYAYITRETLAALGEAPVLHELRVAFTGDTARPASAQDIPAALAAVEAKGTALAQRLEAQGHAVHQLRVPPPGQHPHQRQMVTILVMLLAFASMALVLSAILVANALAALLARQVREIGVMKALGAGTWAIARLYAVLVGLLGVAALALAAPLSAFGTRGITGGVSHLLNFNLSSVDVPAWVFLVQAAAGIGVPLLAAAVPIIGASRRTVRAALDDHGGSDRAPAAWLARLPVPIRNTLARPARLVLALTLLASGVAMALTALQVKGGWEATVAQVYVTRSYDVEVVLNTPAPTTLAKTLAALPGIRAAEAWGYAPAAFSREGGVDVVHTYPDRGHGSLLAMGVPPETTLVRYPLKAGRWLEAGDRGSDAVVLNHAAAAQAPGLKIGDTVLLGIEGRKTRWRLVGIVEEIGAAGGATRRSQRPASPRTPRVCSGWSPVRQLRRSAWTPPGASRPRWTPWAPPCSR